MADTHDDNQDRDSAPDAPETDSAPNEAQLERTAADASAGDAQLAPAQLGVTRYVLAAFMGVAVIGAYVAGKSLEAIWNGLASWPAATRHASWLVLYREDERPTFTMTLGLLIGVAFGVWLYKKASVRQWADDVATELAKVHWPSREIVQNGTVVVLVAGLFATVYVGLLDRLWVFVTALIYGA